MDNGGVPCKCGHKMANHFRRHGKCNGQKIFKRDEKGNQLDVMTDAAPLCDCERFGPNVSRGSGD